MPRPTIHLLVPAYGPSPYLEQTLQSALAAQDEHVMITVVDDGSPGKEVAMAATAAGVELVRLAANRGVAGAFQACVELSRGDYTVLLGADDLLEPGFSTTVCDLIEQHGFPAMVLAGVTVIDSAGARVQPLADRVKRVLTPRQPALLAGERLATSLLLGNWLYFPALAWRTDLLKEYGFRQDLPTALDLDLELRLVFDGHALAWSPQPVFRYRRHSASASSLTAVSGTRFDEERELHDWAAARARLLRWHRAELAARLHPTTRLHAGLLRASALASTVRRGRRH